MKAPRGRLTTPKRERIRTVAALKSQIPSMKTLAVELGLTVCYVRQLICIEVIRMRTNKRSVSRETITDEEFQQLRGPS